jgi:hypothetical protein
MLLILMTGFVVAGLWLGIFLFGAVTAYRGIRGKYGERYPICARCRYILLGLPVGRTNCPECGSDLRVLGATALWRDGSRAAPIAIGVAIMLGALSPIGFMMMPRKAAVIAAGGGVVAPMPATAPTAPSISSFALPAQSTVGMMDVEREAAAGASGAPRIVELDDLLRQPAQPPPSLISPRPIAYELPIDEGVRAGMDRPAHVPRDADVAWVSGPARDLERPEIGLGFPNPSIVRVPSVPVPEGTYLGRIPSPSFEPTYVSSIGAFTTEPPGMRSLHFGSTGWQPLGYRIPDGRGGVSASWGLTTPMQFGSFASSPSHATLSTSFGSARVIGAPGITCSR